MTAHPKNGPPLARRDPPGSSFEAEVAELYRLLGAAVTQNIEVTNNKIDIFAVFHLPGSSIGHRVIVECKDEARAIAQNQRVMQFKGLLATAREAGAADSAAIVTRVPWSDQAKGFARNAGVELLTYAEKVAQLIDFTQYLTAMRRAFEEPEPERATEPALAAYYVESNLQRLWGKGSHDVDFSTYLREWLGGPSKHHVAILSGYGTGKTSFCKKLTHDLARSYQDSARPPGARIPILLDLRGFTKTVEIEPFIASFLDIKCGVLNPRFSLFRKMNDAGLFLLIFDGFDEMAARVDADTLEMNILEIEKLAASPLSRILITSRAEYFTSAEEQARLFRPRGAGREALETRSTEYEGLTIQQWDEQRVNEFLRRRVPLVTQATRSWTYYRDRIKKVRGLWDLARRPVLLDMIVKTLPTLIETGKAIDRPGIYRTYLSGELSRQKIQKKRTLLLTEENRVNLLTEFAVDVHTKRISAITFADARNRVRQLNPPDQELEAYVRDFLTCSFLVREGDGYRFSHRSIMEYLTARGLLVELARGTVEGWAKEPLTNAITEFLIELKPNRDSLIRALTVARKRDEWRYVAGNAATVLCRLGRKGLQGVDFTEQRVEGADLRFADLSQTRFLDCTLVGCNLVGARFQRRAFVKARLRNVIVGLTLVIEPLRQLPEDSELQRAKLKELIAFAGVSLEGWSVDEVESGFRVATLHIRVADEERLGWVEHALSRHPGLRARALYASDYEMIRKSFPKDVGAVLENSNISAMSSAFGGLATVLRPRARGGMKLEYRPGIAD